jgi:hypothetical protein
MSPPKEGRPPGRERPTNQTPTPRGYTSRRCRESFEQMTFWERAASGKALPHRLFEEPRVDEDGWAA